MMHRLVLALPPLQSQAYSAQILNSGHNSASCALAPDCCAIARLCSAICAVLQPLVRALSLRMNPAADLAFPCFRAMQPPEGDNADSEVDEGHTSGLASSP